MFNHVLFTADCFNFASMFCDHRVLTYNVEDLIILILNNLWLFLRICKQQNIGLKNVPFRYDCTNHPRELAKACKLKQFDIAPVSIASRKL